MTHYEHIKRHSSFLRVQELCDSRGGRPGLPVPNSPYSLCGRKATLNSLNSFPNRAQELCPNSPCGLCGRKATLNLSVSLEPVWPSDNLADTESARQLKQTKSVVYGYRLATLPLRIN